MTKGFLAPVPPRVKERHDLLLPNVEFQTMRDMNCENTFVVRIILTEGYPHRRTSLVLNFRNPTSKSYIRMTDLLEHVVII